MMNTQMAWQVCTDPAASSAYGELTGGYQIPTSLRIHGTNGIFSLLILPDKSTIHASEYTKTKVQLKNSWL